MNDILQPDQAVYAATKALISFLAKGIEYEERGKSKIDYFVLEPSGISTGMVSKEYGFPYLESPKNVA